MIAIAGVLTGYNGSFEFKEPGQKYEDTPYLGMRVVSCYVCMYVMYNVVFTTYSPFGFVCVLVLCTGLCNDGSTPHPSELPHCLGDGQINYCCFYHWSDAYLW